MDSFTFPPVDTAVGPGIVAVGGNLGPGMLLSAYRQGIFPWFSPGEPIMWWAPDPRFVLFPEDFHRSRRLGRRIASGVYTVRADLAFEAVMAKCAGAPRRGQDGTWITDSMLEAYIRLHHLGYAHSFETYRNGELVGGLYGVSLGRAFFGESMFAEADDASKVALDRLVGFARRHDFLFIDSQVYTAHLSSLGARDLPRDRFMALLAEALDAPDLLGPWTTLLDRAAST